MKKTTTPPIDPINIFKQAEEFFQALNHMHAWGDRITLFFNPMFVTASFTSELYFKTIICLESREPPRIHNLYELFQRMSPDAKANLEKRWDEIQYQQEPIMEEIEDGSRIIWPRDLRTNLIDGAESFELLRYAYEPGINLRFGLGFLPLALRRTVLDIKPDWSAQDTVRFAKRGVKPKPDDLPQQLKVGTIALRLKHDDADWSTNDCRYDLTQMNMDGLIVVAVKTPDRLLHVFVGGPLGGTFKFVEPMPEADARGIHVVLRWTLEDGVTIFLNGKRATTIKPP